MLELENAPGRKRETRALVLSDGSRAIGLKWVRDWCREMQRDGRPLAGGWPGTVPEARARVAAYLASALLRRGMLALTYDELVCATRTAYDEAKREWLSVLLAQQPRARRRKRRVKVLP